MVKVFSQTIVFKLECLEDGFPISIVFVQCAIHLLTTTQKFISVLFGSVAGHMALRNRFPQYNTKMDKSFGRGLRRVLSKFWIEMNV